jgi:hypothetical protein
MHSSLNSSGNTDTSGSSSTEEGDRDRVRCPKYFLGIPDLEQVVRLGQAPQTDSAIEVDSGSVEDGRGHIEGRGGAASKVPSQTPLTQGEVDKLKAWILEDDRSRAKLNNKKKGMGYLRGMNMLAEGSDESDIEKEGENDKVERNEDTNFCSF